MKVDVAKLAEQAERKKRERRGVHAERESQRLDGASMQITTWRSDVVEGRVLTALIVEPEVLPWCDSLELEDFCDPRNRLVFGVLRNLQAKAREHGWPWTPTTDQVMNHLREREETTSSHATEAVEIYLATLLCEHVWNTYGEPGAPVRAWVEQDLRKLRELADARRSP